MKKENVKTTTKFTTKCLQYEWMFKLQNLLVNKLQQPNQWMFKLFFVIGDILVCKPIV